MGKRRSSKSKSRGTVVEGVIKQFCQRPFLYDFIFLRPRRLDNNSELTDLLVVLDNKCLCIEIKALGKDTARSGEALIRWANRRLVEASKVSDACSAIMTSASSAKHNWQEKVTFQAGDLKPISGLALVEYIGQPFKITFEICHMNPDGIPIQYFALNDFLNIVNILGTLPDILEYLQQRALLSDELKSVIGNEKDLVAEYLLKGNLMPSLSLKDIQGKFDYIVKVHGAAFERKLRYDEYVIFYNGIIDELHNMDTGRQSYWPSELLPHMTTTPDKQKYLQIAKQLNTLPLLYRRDIGRRLLTAAKNVEKLGKSRCFYCLDHTQQWVLAFLVTPDMDRQTRISHLNQLAAIALTKLKRYNTIAVACPSMDSSMGFDYILYEKVSFDNPEIQRLASLEPDPRTITLKSFPDPADDFYLPNDIEFQ